MLGVGKVSALLERLRAYAAAHPADVKVVHGVIQDTVSAAVGPALPSLRALTASLRALHSAFSHPDGGGEYVCLVNAGQAGWILENATHPDGVGREYVPGDGKRFDAVAAARRLLASAMGGEP